MIIRDFSLSIAGALLLSNLLAEQLQAQVSDAQQPIADPREPIIKEEEFDETLPAIDPEAPMGSVAEWKQEQERLEAEARRDNQEDGVSELPALQDGTADELIADAPVNDPEIDDPLVPLAEFNVEPFDESQFTEATENDGDAALRYTYRIDGLEALDESGESAVRPVGAGDIRSWFRELSALREGDGKAANGAMVSARMREDQQLLLDIMSGQGYFDATVNGSVELPAAEGERLTAVLLVTPGQRYDFGTINFAAQNVDPADLISKNFVPDIGEPIVAERVLAAEANIAVVLPQEGYPFVEIGQRDILLDPDTGTADYTLPIDLGPRSVYGEIVTTGTTAFDADHIANLTRFEKGELYDSRMVDDLRQALVATGLFSIVSVEPSPSGKTAPNGTEYATINVAQEAGPPRTLAGSAGYNTGQGFRLEGSWTHRNFFPPEGALIGSVIPGTQEQGASITFRRSNAGRRDRTVELGLSALRSDFDAFEALTGRLGARVSYDSTPIWQKRLTYSYGAELLGTNEQGFNLETGELDRNTFYVAVLPGQVTWDTTDSLLDPTEGFRLSAQISPEASLGSGTQVYGRGIFEGTAYYKATDGIVVAGRARIGSIVGADRALLAPSRRLYAGGGGSVRGFGFQEVGPKADEPNPNFDPTDPEETDNPTRPRPIGGRSLVEAAAEVRYRFGDYGVVGFVDAGQVYPSSTPGFDDLRFGVGVGGRFYTNFGPLRLDVATPINRREGESLISVYISIGQAF